MDGILNHLWCDCPDLNRTWPNIYRLIPKMVKRIAAPNMPKPPTELALLLGKNVRILLTRKYGDKGEQAWQKDIDWNSGSLGRVLKASVETRVNTVELLAKACGVEPYQLFVDIPEKGEIPKISPLEEPRPQVDRALAGAWKHLSDQTKKRMIDEAIAEAGPLLEEHAQLLDIFRIHQNEGS